LGTLSYAIQIDGYIDYVTKQNITNAIKNNFVGEPGESKVILSSFWIHPLHVNKGYGTKILRSLLRLYSAKGTKLIAVRYTPLNGWPSACMNFFVQNEFYPIKDAAIRDPDCLHCVLENAVLKMMIKPILYESVEDIKYFRDNDNMKSLSKSEAINMIFIPMIKINGEKISETIIEYEPKEKRKRVMKKVKNRNIYFVWKLDANTSTILLEYADEDDPAWTDNLSQISVDEIRMLYPPNIDKVSAVKLYLTDDMLIGLLHLVAQSLHEAKIKALILHSNIQTYLNLYGINYGPTTNVYRNINVLYCPFNKNKNHWVLVIAYPRSKEMYFLDGLSNDDKIYGNTCMYLVLSWILRMTELFEDEFQIEDEVVQWKFFTNSKNNIPKQHDGYNCGILAVKYALYSARGILSFDAFESSIKACANYRGEFQHCINQKKLFDVPQMPHNLSNTWHLNKPTVNEYRAKYHSFWGEGANIEVEVDLELASAS
jgi:hypothetical protein